VTLCTPDNGRKPKDAWVCLGLPFKTHLCLDGEICRGTFLTRLDVFCLDSHEHELLIKHKRRGAPYGALAAAFSTLTLSDFSEKTLLEVAHCAVNDLRRVPIAMMASNEDTPHALAYSPLAGLAMMLHKEDNRRGSSE